MQGQPCRVSRLSLNMLILLWSGAVGGGYFVLENYALAPGQSGEAPSQWPADSQLHRTSGQLTLVMFAHPHCPCTRASIDEFAHVMAQCGDRLTAYVLFYKPSTATPGWERTELWRAAEAIPGVRVTTDLDQLEAKMFGAETSGDVLLYDAAGRLLFHGGITAARGHSGDNLGHRAILALALTRKASLNRTAVFGCPLSEKREVWNRE